jgi:hypothetical protein
MSKTRVPQQLENANYFVKLQLDQRIHSGVLKTMRHWASWPAFGLYSEDSARCRARFTWSRDRQEAESSGKATT